MALAEESNRWVGEDKAASSPVSRVEQFLASHTRYVELLLAKTDAARWGVTQARFAEVLKRSAEHRFRGASPSDAELAAYLESLHVEDLVLACACSHGDEPAWEHFITKYREDLYAAARAIVGPSGYTDGGTNEAQARELADSLYAELYGLRSANVGEGNPASSAAVRRPLFDYFHGRSKLSTWLRAVLAQRHVDAIRAAQRTESLDQKDESYIAEILRAHGAPVKNTDPERARYLYLLQTTVVEALAALSARDRLRLASYYVQELTLAQIGRILGEHEATVSRNLERTRGELRKRIERALREKGLKQRQIDLCLQCAADEWPYDLTRALSPEDSGTKMGNKRNS